MKIEDVLISKQPIQIKTITLNGKKITKSLIQQMPIYWCFFHGDNEDNQCYGIYKLNEHEHADYERYGEILGRVNIEIEPAQVVRRMMSRTNKQMQNYEGSIYLVLCTDENGDIFRSYIDDYCIATANLKIEQLYI